MASTSTRTFLAVLIGVAVLWFGLSGSDGKGPTPALLFLALIAAGITWYLTRQQNAGK